MDPNAFHKISYGLYVVSSSRGDKLNGQIANTVFQVTSQPPMVAVSSMSEPTPSLWGRLSRLRF